jgi:hypothetical protein
LRTSNYQKMNKLLIILLAVVMTTVACSKKKGCTDPISINYNSDAEKDDGSCAYAGEGGSSVIAATLVHHTFHIVSTAQHPDTAFVKFNAKDAPAAGAGYDLTVIGEVGEDHVHIEGLKPGYYWVQCSGYDSTIAETVTGGVAVTVSSNGQEVNQTVFVTE